MIRSVKLSSRVRAEMGARENRLQCAPRPSAGAIAHPEEIRAVFAEVFGIPLPAAMLPPRKLYSIGGYCYCSDKSFRSAPYLFDLKKMPIGFYVLGFWESSAHTYFSYCRADEWRRIDLRMIYGGFYENWKACKEQIREFLIAYCSIEDQLSPNVRTLYLGVDLGFGICRVVWNDGKKQELEINNPKDFLKLLSGEEQAEAIKPSRKSKQKTPRK